MSKRINGICLIKPWLKNYHGHFYNYATSILRGASSRGLQFKVMANAECSSAIQHALPLHNVFPQPNPFFTRSKYHILLFAPFGYNFAIYRGLKSKQMDFLNEQWVVLVGTADYTNLFALAAWLRCFKPEQAPMLVLTLRLTHYRTDLHRWSPQVVWYWAGLKLIEKLAHRYRVCLVTDSDILIEESRKITSLPVHVLPIPHVDNVNIATRSSIQNRKAIKMTSLGTARDVKGFIVLAEAIKQLHDRQDLTGLAFHLHVFCNASTCGPDIRSPEILNAVNTLKSLNSPVITFADNPLSESDYNKDISDSDVILIPYWQFKYASNTSGIFAEALAAAKPVIVTEGTWMSAQLDKYGSGVTFQDRNVDDLVRAILYVRDNFIYYEQRARERQQDWISYHSPENFVSEILKTLANYDK